MVKAELDKKVIQHEDTQLQILQIADKNSVQHVSAVTYPSDLLVNSINALTGVSGHVKTSIPTDNNSPSDTTAVDVKVILTGYQDATLTIPFTISSHNINGGRRLHHK